MGNTRLSEEMTEMGESSEFFAPTSIRNAQFLTFPPSFLSESGLAYACKLIDQNPVVVNVPELGWSGHGYDINYFEVLISKKDANQKLFFSPVETNDSVFSDPFPCKPWRVYVPFPH